MIRNKLNWVGAAFFAIALMVIGCGGGGGSASSTTATSTATTSTSSTSGTTGGVVMLVAENSSGVVVDPTNLNPGQSVQFMVVSVTPGTYAVTTLPTGSFTTTDSTGAAGSLNSQTGAFTANASTGGTVYTVSSNYNGTLYSENYGVKPVQATVTGRVVDSNLVPVPFAELVFEDATNTQVGAVMTGPDGSFSASIPSTAVRFNIVPSSIPIVANPLAVPSTAYFRYFTFGQGTYNPLNTACSAPLPALSSGTTTALSSQVVVYAAATLSGVANLPPSPPGCSP